MLLGLWLFFPRFGNIIAASSDGRWAAMVSSGWVEVVRSEEPSLAIMSVESGAPELIKSSKAIWEEVLARDADNWRTQRIRMLATWAPGSAMARAAWRTPAHSDGRLGNRFYPAYGRGHVWVPTWCLAAPFLSLAWLTASRDRRCRRNEREDICPCGYNREGLTAADAVCPECGAARP